MTTLTDHQTTPATTPSLAVRVMRNAANFFSFILSPLLGPTFAIIIAWNSTVMLLLPTGTMRTLTLVVFGLTCLFPMVAIGIMYKMGIVSDPGLNNRRERTLPFAVSAAGYVACLVFLHHIHSPWWITMFMAGGLLALVIAALVNLRWKISIHLTAMGGLVAFVVRLITEHLAMVNGQSWLIATIVAAGLVGSSRLLLNRHTPMQVLAGSANGFLCVYLMMGITY